MKVAAKFIQDVQLLIERFCEHQCLDVALLYTVYIFHY